MESAYRRPFVGSSRRGFLQSRRPKLLRRTAGATLPLSSKRCAASDGSGGVKAWVQASLSVPTAHEVRCLGSHVLLLLVSPQTSVIITALNSIAMCGETGAVGELRLPCHGAGDWRTCHTDSLPIAGPAAGDPPPPLPSPPPDELTPYIVGVCDSLERHHLPGDWTPKAALDRWWVPCRRTGCGWGEGGKCCIHCPLPLFRRVGVLRAMRAIDHLTGDQLRQMKVGLSGVVCKLAVARRSYHQLMLMCPSSSSSTSKLSITRLKCT
jgi:hypothetical protein